MICLSLRVSQVLIDRKKWIDLAEECEKADAPLTCASIIRAVIGLGVEKEDRKRTWLADAEVGAGLRCPFVRGTGLPAAYVCSVGVPSASLATLLLIWLPSRHMRGGVLLPLFACMHDINSF